NHKKTITGGRMSEDFTGGYGPEEFLIRRAIKGNYKVEINYYGSSSQKITGPTTVQVKLITNFGRPNQKIKEVTRRLEKSEGVIHIGDISI
ncbi:MAG: DUF2135 domain-containing protein, partial [Flavobacteriales bacterium]|nr:DUF2135 domain-containing protein [Flavobacteriales bacterium]